MRVDASTAGIWISFNIEDEEYLAFISAAALRDRFNAADTSLPSLRGAYMVHRTLIDSVARQKFLNGAARPVRLVAADFPAIGRTAGKKTGPASPRK